MIQAKGKVNENAMFKLDMVFDECLYMSTLDMKVDLQQSGTMPLLTGQLQENQKVIPYGETSYKLVAEMDYAEEMYEYPFPHTSNEEHEDNDYCASKARDFGTMRSNANAQPHWLDTYLNGDKSNFVRDAFANQLSRRLSK